MVIRGQVALLTKTSTLTLVYLLESKHFYIKRKRGFIPIQTEASILKRTFSSDINLFYDYRFTIGTPDKRQLFHLCIITYKINVIILYTFYCSGIPLLSSVILTNYMFYVSHQYSSNHNRQNKNKNNYFFLKNLFYPIQTLQISTIRGLRGKIV